MGLWRLGHWVQEIELHDPIAVIPRKENRTLHVPVTKRKFLAPARN
jgi:hypothetical protein